jgi:hypothetical protein
VALDLGGVAQVAPAAQGRPPRRPSAGRYRRPRQGGVAAVLRRVSGKWALYLSPSVLSTLEGVAYTFSSGPGLDLVLVPLVTVR